MIEIDNNDRATDIYCPEANGAIIRGVPDTISYLGGPYSFQHSSDVGESSEQYSAQPTSFPSSYDL
jgi:hypothetical protein